MDVALFDEENPIMEWLSSARSESDPVLDQEEIREGIDRIEQDHPSPTNLVIDDVIIDMSGHRFLAEPISACAKRKRSKDGKRAKKKKGKSLHIDEEDVASGDGTDSDSHGTRSPEYAKSGDSSSASEDIHDDYNDNSAAKNGTSNYAPAQNTEGAEGRPIWRAKRRVKNINTLVKGAMN
ncbi:hypothetical protein E2562_005917 [Oryza meyeriana var. granulata]|uniref:Uncharacterized protein n=1 Tax=Oryza meyeriana var. granulata TaxID=110450 RepID=A0A6G1DW28_9ORYZ|nr:hypothetical protein E2562_005917 [Oryza meyeriana var. granulata]